MKVVQIVMPVPWLFVPLFLWLGWEPYYDSQSERGDG